MTKFLIPIFLFILSFSILSINIKKPFVGAHDFNGVFFGQIAKNYFRYNFETKLGQVVNADITPKNEWAYHTHHPPLLPLMLAVFGVLFGFSESALRLVPVIFSGFSIILIYLIGKELFSKTVGFIASLLPMGTPLFAYYAKMPVHEPLILTFLLAAIWQYLYWVKSKKSVNYYLMIFFTILGLLSGWPFYYFPILLGLYTYLYNRKNFKQILPIAILPVVFVLLQLIHVKILTGSYLTGIFDAFILRVGSSFSVLEFLKTELQFLNAFLGKIILVLSLAFLINLIISIKNKIKSKQIGLILMFGIAGSLHLIAARNASVRHDYLIFLLIPFFAFSSALILEGITNKIGLKIKLNKNLLLLMMGIAVSIFVGVEKLKFTNALITGEINKPGFIVGSTVSKLTSPGDRVLFANQEFTEFFGPFVAFYADRQVDYVDLKLDYFSEKRAGLEKNYKYLIVDTSRPFDQSLDEQLSRIYNKEAVNNVYNFYRLR
ncbi:MAG TPA: glycosyltransferase family 39 protein [Patescibacteria group bacterium]